MFTENEEFENNSLTEEQAEPTYVQQETMADTASAKVKKVRRWPYTVLGLFLGAVIGVSATLGVTMRATSATSSDVIKQITGNGKVTTSSTKMAQLIALIKTYYYKDVDDDTLVNGMYAGLYESLDDPYSAYYTAEEFDDLMVSLTGDYAGIGALLSKNAETGIVSISKVYKNTPAEESGLQSGDIIVSADEFEATAEDLDQFVTHIRGTAGTSVTLTIIRGDETLEIVCTRAKISTPTVEYEMLDEKTGYIELSQFANNTYDDFVAAMEDLQSQGMTQVIFDLRNNGGGLLDSVEKMLDYILPEGIVVYTMDKYGNRVDSESDGSTYIDMPIVVLVNGYSASASEIFTGAIRDFHYGTIIGTKTFGKGIVQSTIPLSDGSAVKLTTDSYYTPSGECIHGVGISPDIELEYEFLGTEDDEYSKDLDNQIQKALEVLSGQ